MKVLYNRSYYMTDHIKICKAVINDDYLKLFKSREIEKLMSSHIIKKIILNLKKKNNPKDSSYWNYIRFKKKCKRVKRAYQKTNQVSYKLELYYYLGELLNKKILPTRILKYSFK